MYCPKCAQAQVSEEIRFCSRSGLELAAVREWLATGNSSALVQLAPAARKMSSRRRAMRRGAKVMFLSAALLTFTFGIAPALNAPELLMIPLAVFIPGLAWMSYARLFIEENPPFTQPMSKMAGGEGKMRTLFGSGVGNRRVAGQGVGTAEMVQPQSVSEHTTHLLEKG